MSAFTADRGVEKVGLKLAYFCGDFGLFIEKSIPSCLFITTPCLAIQNYIMRCKATPPLIEHYYCGVIKQILLAFTKCINLVHFAKARQYEVSCHLRHSINK